MTGIRMLKKSLDARRRANFDRDKEGRAVIEMRVLRDEDFLSDLSVGRPIISQEVADFLEESALAIPARETLALHIYSHCIDDKEQKVYSSAIREYFLRRYDRGRGSLRRNLVTAVIMAIVGLLVLTLMVVFSLLEFVPVLGETIDIAAWVFLWEAVDLFFLQRPLLKAEERRYLAFAHARIRFFAVPAPASDIR